jgi:hypothetical protein
MAPLSIFLPVLFFYSLASQRLEGTKYVQLVCILMLASRGHNFMKTIR